LVKGESGHWSITGTFWSLVAGVITSVGALGIVLALAAGGKPVYVMPLVFGCAPVVNTLVTMYMARTWREANVVFIVGIVVVALGAAGVLIFKPAEGSAAINLPVSEFVVVLTWIAVTALCWGAYGPLLHKGQMMMKGSRLRPFMCVGLAYFAVAIVIPIAILTSESGIQRETMLNVQASLWSLAAGAAGAIGSLGLILAFNFGGKPIFVMPLVFGCAPVVNTFTTMIAARTLHQVNTVFLVSLALVIAGAVTVLLFAPRSHPPKPGEAKKEKQPADSKPKHEPKAKTEAKTEAKETPIARSHDDGKPAPEKKAVDEKAAAEK
jgi:hypothetical protein